MIWTTFDMDVLVDPRNMPVEEFLIFLKIQDGHQWSKIEFQIKMRLKNHISAWQTVHIHPIWTKFGRNILLDPSNKPTE